MKKVYTITEEEFGAIKEAVSAVLQFWHYKFISADDGNGAAIGMSKETFFEELRNEFNIIQ